MPEFRFIFTAQNYEQTVAFYTGQLGLPVVTSWGDDGRGIIVSAADGEIEVFAHVGPGPAPRVTGAAIAWEVADIDADFERLEAAGVTILEDPTDRPWGHRSAVIEDPDGLRITLFTVTSSGH
jgi:catechol 2,3-dioxygenase-like lactoylglutathione lyase family enzyme